MACATGQVDLNHASVSALTSLPTPDEATLSTSVASQIIAGRPFLQPTDLKAPAVQGVTENHVRLWLDRGLVCATPIFQEASDGTSVPSTPSVCDSLLQADFNDPNDYEQFVALFGRPTADRVRSGIPYPSTYNALRRAGVSAGLMKKHAQRVCATPYPIRHAGVDWAFATPEHGIAVDTSGVFGTYTLTVPGGVTAARGAWASVRETESVVAQNAGLDFFELDAPTVDAHIHGDWTGPVAVTVPPDPTDTGEGYVNAVIHYSDVTGPMIHANEGIATAADGRLTVALEDLSNVTSVSLAERWTQGVRAVTTLLTHAESVLRVLLGVGGSASCNPDLTEQTLPDGERFDVDSSMFNFDTGNLTPRLDHCITRQHGAGNVPDGSFTNNRGIVFVAGDHGSTRLHDVDDEGGILWQVIAGPYNRLAVDSSLPVLLSPGAAVSAHPRAFVGSFTVETDPFEFLTPTVAYWLLDELAGFVPEQLSHLLLLAPDCAVRFVDAVVAADGGIEDPAEAGFGALSVMLHCFSEALKNTDEFELVRRFLPTSGTVGNVIDTGVLLNRLKRAVTMITVAKYATVFLDAAEVAGTDGTVTMKWRPAEPASPTRDAAGRPVFDACVRKSFTYESGWSVVLNDGCQDLAYGTSPTPPPPAADGPPVDAFDDWIGNADTYRLYNLLRRDSNGVLHLILLDNGELVAHPIDASEEWSFKEDWPEHEWTSDEFALTIDRVGTPAVNDPLRLRFFTEGRGHSWLLRQADGTAWKVDADGLRQKLVNVAGEMNVAKRSLTLHPAQFAHDICPYREFGDTSTALRVC